MASFDTLQKLSQHPEWVAPRSDLRVFLGQPGGPEANKTTVEPGNAFSPGMMTFGVTWWLRFPKAEPDEAIFFAPELAPLESLRWSYEDGYFPILSCQTSAGGLQVEHVLFQDGCWEERSEATAARLTLVNSSAHPLTAQVFLALRSLGPAGGALKSLKVGPDRCSFWDAARDLPLLGADTVPDLIGCGVGDPSVLARHGLAPGVNAVEDPAGWCFGMLRCDLILSPGERWQITLDCPHQSYGPVAGDLPSSVPPRPGLFDTRRLAHHAAWESRFGEIGLEVPDTDFKNAFFAGVQHMMTAMVGDQARIAALAYPLPWLRDSIFIIRCLDLAGFHDLARAASEYIARQDFFGGFGAEGDAPGEGLWALVQHYRVTGDRGWLESVYPGIRRKVDWLLRMRRATGPIRVVAETPVLAFTQAQRNTGIICTAARDGIIRGTMDHGIDYSVGWVNHWAIGGLREAAYAAAELGHSEDAQTWLAEAGDLFSALKEFAGSHAAFFEYERTANSLVWPTQAWRDDLDFVRAPFEAWWAKNRGDGEEFQPEPYWLYFEESQAHNALLLGSRERAWQAVDYRLRHQDLPGLYGWREGGEGVGTENATQGVTLIPFLRGCHKYESITPHGWSQAEMWLLQRGMLAEEWGSTLLLFAGVPEHWLRPNARLALRSFPTWFGKLDASLTVDPDGRRARVEVQGLRPGTLIEVRLPGATGRAAAGLNHTQLDIDLTKG
jgi:hypothetical protein